jgi:PAS domain S-box-containing protein
MNDVKVIDILLVEDDPAHAESIRRSFRSSGRKAGIRVVGTLREFREQMAARVPDLAVLDLSLPDGKATDVLSSPPEAGLFPILVITSYGDERIAVAALKAGALDYIVKSPEAFASMPHSVERALREWALLQARKLAEAQREAAIGDLRKSEAIFDQFMKNSPVYVFFKDENIRAIRLSENYETMLGKPVSELLGKNMDELFSSEFAKSIVADDLRILQEGTRIETEEELNGRFYTTIKFPIHIEGKPSYLAGFTIDVTDRKRMENDLRAAVREKEVMLREIHHRVKNNMQVISSLFNLQSGHTLNQECRKILKEGQTRLRAMSLVHEKLYQSLDLSKIDLAAYIQSLAIHLFHVYLVDPDQVRLETDFGEVALDINSAVPCGLILNELISNSLKHAFPEGRQGLIRIGLKREADDTIVLRVEDDGIGFPTNLDFRQVESFGLQIVNLLVGQLDAAIDLDRANGTAFTATFRELKYAPRI